MRMLPFFMHHYSPWVSRFFIYDDGSTDGSPEFLNSFSSVEVRKFERLHRDSLVASQRDLYNTCWHESRGRADWVIVTNIDEHLFHPEMQEYLAQCKNTGITAMPGLGCQMVSDEFPASGQHLCHSVTQGMPWANMNKLSIFDPNEIAETSYAVGRHTANPTGNVVYPMQDEVLNLHFKYLGLPYLVQRSAELKTGLGTKDIEKKWGHKYLWPEDEVKADFLALKEQSIDIMNANPTDFTATRWWRED